MPTVPLPPGGAATATVLLNTVSGIAEEVFPKLSEINAPKGLITPEYSGGPETFLVLGTDRREGSKDAADRANPPHSDTMLLVRFDPVLGRTSVMSISVGASLTGALRLMNPLPCGSPAG